MFKDLPLPRVFRNREFLVLECRIDHCRSWGGLGICDSCNQVSLTGFVPMALNWYLCPACFNSWLDRAQWYEEDRWVSDRNLTNYLSHFLKIGVPVARDDLSDGELGV